MEKFDIEAYLDGSLNPAERAAFEAEMAGNPEFAREVRLMQQLTGDVQTQLLRDHVTHTLRDSGPGGGKKNIPFWLSGLAVLLLFCTAGYFLFMPGKTAIAPGVLPVDETPSTPAEPGAVPENSGETAPQTTPQTAPGKKPPANRPIAANTPLPDPRFPAPNIRGTGQTDTALAALLDRIWYMDFPPAGTRFAPPYDEAGRLLQARDFSKAYIRLELLERANPASDTLRFLKGYCLLELGQGKESLRYLDAGGSAATWAAHRQWYRALALLSSGRKEEAKTALETIRDSRGHPFQRQGAKALELMK